MIISTRDILACLAIEEKGNWDAIYSRIKERK